MFCRYAKSQADQFAGQAIGLPFFQAAFSALSVAVTSATVVIFGAAISDPVEVSNELAAGWFQKHALARFCELSSYHRMIRFTPGVISWALNCS